MFTRKILWNIGSQATKIFLNMIKKEIDRDWNWYWIVQSFFTLKFEIIIQIFKYLSLFRNLKNTNNPKIYPNITYLSLLIVIKSDAFLTLESNFLLCVPIPLEMICSIRFLKSIGMSHCFHRSLLRAKLSIKINFL